MSQKDVQTIFSLLTPDATPGCFQDHWGFLQKDTSFHLQQTIGTPRKLEILEFFLPDTLKTPCLMINLTHRWAQSGHFFFDSQKCAGYASLIYKKEARF